ncbi:hypothetical protein [Aliihoeflea sp. 40Bstr573]|uniref:hypothetical protein n=1 Tax=Aliihoeflea sp. 40Bstr573 TaxID=2696467 RepID=UPI0020963387|nr:hypothetical protein [Aliihoeflea sp. 40Bstr573]MCO6386262.1 hypothetical protein [Aliihoeflea sp. 40Bstr573]
MTIFQNTKGLSLHEPLFSKEGDFLFLTLKANDRLCIATTIERLIDKLDAMDTDCDLEDGADDEPSLCGTIAPNGEVDLEADDCDEEWSGDEQEPLLGWTESHGMGVVRGQTTDDREGDDERDDDGDQAEHFLGWSERCSQGADNPALLMSGMDPDESGPCGYGFTGSGAVMAKQLLTGRVA